MLRVCACRPPTLTDSDEQQHECGYRQWSDKLIDFPTVSMKSPGETLSQRQSYNNEGNANDSLFYLAVRNCESHKRAQARIPPRHSFCHIITRHRAAPLQNSATDIPGIVGGIFREKKESVVGWLSRCTGRASLCLNCSMSSDNLIGNRQQH